MPDDGLDLRNEFRNPVRLFHSARYSYLPGTQGTRKVAIGKGCPAIQEWGMRRPPLIRIQPAPRGKLRLAISRPPGRSACVGYYRQSSPRMRLPRVYPILDSESL